MRQPITTLAQLILDAILPVNNVTTYYAKVDRESNCPTGYITNHPEWQDESKDHYWKPIGEFDDFHAAQEHFVSMIKTSGGGLMWIE